MSDEELKEMKTKIDVLVTSQLASAARLIVLEDAFIVLATRLAQGTPDPVASLESYIADVEAVITRKKGLQGNEAADAAFHVGGAFDNLVYALRSRVPGAAGNRPAN